MKTTDRRAARRKATRKAQRSRPVAPVAAPSASSDFTDVRAHIESAAETLSAKLGGAITPSGVSILVGGLMALFTPRSAKTKLSTEDGRQVPLDGNQIRALGESLFLRASLPAMVSGMFQKPIDPPADKDRQDIGLWFDQGLAEGATHLLVVRDKDHKIRPVYARPGESARTMYRSYQFRNDQQVTAVYSLREDRASQLVEWRPMHID